jgi:polyisoprenoid-binding protein YceI
MTTETHALDGRFTDDGTHSSFEFSIFRNGNDAFRGSLDDVVATLTAGPDGLSLEGTAQVESISIREPAVFRAHVLGEEFFDADNHPEVTFRSTSADLGEDGTARIAGELTIAGAARAVTAMGTWRRTTARVTIDLATAVDRRDFGLDWQMELPGGGNALAWEVRLDVHLELLQQDD